MLILLYFITPFLLHIAYTSVNSWSSSHVSCIVCLDLDLDLESVHTRASSSNNRQTRTNQ